MRLSHLLLGSLLAIATTPALSQTATNEHVLSACSSQQELEQVMQSNGAINPDGCWTLTVNALDADGNRLCLLQIAPNDQNVLGKLQDLASPSEWWVRCDALMASASPSPVQP